MRGRWSFPPPVVLGLWVLLGVSLAFHLLWLIRFRHSSLTEWDEAGYIQIAVLDRVGLAHDGLIGLARAVLHQPGEAPLVPFLAVPVYLVAGTGVFQSLFVLPLLSTVLVLATYGLARRLMSPAWSLLAALAVAGLPAVIDYTRLFHFAVPATTFATLALWALLGSDGMRRRGPMLAAGVFVALMVLSRTMTLAYLPGFALAAGVQLIGRRDLPARAANLGLASLLAAAVAATWYAPNAGSVRSYLVDAGYGASSGSFGASHPVLSFAYWSKELNLVVQQLYGPLALVVAACLLAGIASVLVTGAYRRCSSHRCLAALALAAFVVEGYLVLTSSSNEGTAFALPWLPALVVLAVGGAARARPGALRPALAVLLTSAAVLGIAMKSGFAPALARAHSVPVPLLDDVPILDGRGIIQKEVAGAGYPIGDPTEPLPAMHRRWLPVARRVTEYVVARADRMKVSPEVLVAMDDGLMSNTRFRLAAALSSGRYLPVGTLTAAEGGDRTGAYATKLRESRATTLVTAPAAPGAAHTVNQENVAAAASAVGFRPARSFTLPDGRRLEVWWRGGG